MDSSPDKLLARHRRLVHSENRKVISHVQREQGEWFINTLMLDGYEVPFRYKRKQELRSLAGQRVNLTYYPDVLNVGGMRMEIMKVVRIRVS